jgi:uncharacterized circularly permuted ATP-grasp superfamily protein
LSFVVSEAEGSLLLRGYGVLPGAYDELVDEHGQPRPHALVAAGLLDGLTPESFQRCQTLAELSLVQQGVTFSVYSDQRGTEKVMPMCLVPRVMAATEWARLERGLHQRLTALELFLDDVYGDQHTMREGIVPGEMVDKSKSFEPRLRGIKPAGGVRIHIAGVDLIRDPQGTMRVLEDNLRTPSGVSYVLENRQVTKRVFQHSMESAGVRRVDDYPSQLAEALRSVSPEGVDPEEATVVVLTPGPFNSAYFEHSFLARSMGLELVEASDLVVEGDDVFVRTTMGPRRVHVIYRRTDDAFLDPEFFRPDSLLGVKGLMRAWAKGRVALDLIKFFLKEEPIIEQVPTYVCARRDDRDYVVEHLAELVVKAVDEAGGYGMLMGPQASAAEREKFRALVLADPRKYIAQHRVELSTCPTWVPENKRLEPRRVDLRPYVLATRSRSGAPPGRWVLPGGLTRVALRAGSYVVNSSQGGGSKDTWVQVGGGWA